MEPATGPELRARARVRSTDDSVPVRCPASRRSHSQTTAIVFVGISDRRDDRVRVFTGVTLPSAVEDAL